MVSKRGQKQKKTLKNSSKTFNSKLFTFEFSKKGQKGQKVQPTPPPPSPSRDTLTTAGAQRPVLRETGTGDLGDSSTSLLGSRIGEGSQAGPRREHSGKNFSPKRSRTPSHLRKLVAQPEISHEVAEAILRSRAARTDDKFPGIIHVSHQLALLHGHENVFFCTQCGAVNAGGSLRLPKSLCDGSGESRQKARRKLERGLMPHEHIVADAKRAF